MHAGKDVDSFDASVAEFLAAEKAAGVRPRWRSAGHPDYAKVKIRIAIRNVAVGRLILTAHRVRLPPKLCFALLFRGQRVLALDVNPARYHRNLLVSGSVNCTHWQRWPKMEAEPDTRDLTFDGWLNLFLKEAKVSTTFQVISPPRGVQLRLL